VVAVFANDDLRDALGMVCAELLENAIKYGKPDPRGVQVRLVERRLGDRREVVLSVTNAVEEASHHLNALRQRIAWIKSFASASEAYMAALTQVYERSDAQGGESGLGLVRIAYEGNCSLDCEEPAEGLMAVRAQYVLDATGSILLDASPDEATS
jgi:hypothetical protein